VGRYGCGPRVDIKIGSTRCSECACY
jgi:hypothetical protein